MAPETPGWKAFCSWLDAQVEAGRSVRKVADALGAKAPSLFQWKSRSARPSDAMRLMIREASGIPEDDWLTESELRARAAQQRSARTLTGTGTGA